MTVYLESLLRQNRRDRTALQIRFARKMDETQEYTIHRSAPEYVSRLLGLEHFFDYIRTNAEQLGSKKVLDLGTGIAWGIFGLSKSPMGRDLEFEGISVKRHEAMGKHFGFSRVHITAIEELRGIKDSSIAGMTSVYGALSYTASPEFAAAAIDRKLVPGGVVKSLFSDSFFNINGGRKHNAVTNAFLKRSYDCFLIRNTHDRNMVLLAIKSGGFCKAEELSRADLADHFDQAKGLGDYLLDNFDKLTKDK